MRIETVKIQLIKEEGREYNCSTNLNSAEAAADLLREHIGPSDREHFVMVCMNTKNRPTCVHTVSVGSLSASIVHPREVFKTAILSNAAAILFGHNHPSGDSAPSREDHAITAKLKEGADLLGIRILDHVVIGDADFYSFADHGLL